MIAGKFLRQRLLQTAMYGTAHAGIVIGLGIGMAFYAVGMAFYAAFPPWIAFGWGFLAYGATATAVWRAARYTLSPDNSWNVENLAKGAVAETRVGQVIECAITAEHCAVAHSVTEKLDRESWRHRSPRRHTESGLGHRDEVRGGTAGSLVRNSESHRGQYGRSARMGGPSGAR